MSIETPVPAPSASGDQPPSVTAIVVFVCALLVLAPAIFLAQWIVWYLEQTALASTSLGFLAVTGRLWFVLQAFLVALGAGLLFAFSHNSLRPVYRGWLLAALVTLPALVLRFLGPNDDQLGALVQIVIGLLGGGILLLIRRRSLDFSLRPVLTALVVVPLAIWPFLLWGALGSPADLLLDLLAGLAFGLLAAALLAPTSGHFLLDGLGAGLLLLILGSAFGYDGGQLLLISVLPAFGFGLAALAPSVPAVAVAVGLLAAAPLVFIDPTELGIILGDLFNWALRAAGLMALNGLLIGLVLWLLRRRSAPQPVTAFFALLAWAGAFALYFVFGQPGFYGDQLFVILKDQPDLSQAAQIQDHTQRASYVYTLLTSRADKDQAELRQAFDRFGVHYQPYYLVNAMQVQGGTLVRLYLLTRPEVARVLASPHLRPLPEPGGAIMTGDPGQAPGDPGWNIRLIGADRVWSEFGATGKGIVVGQSDTGVDASHPALSDSYRGKTQGDDYNWFDPWNHTRTPHDSQGHGTHTLGTVLGKGGIGVAPDATWMACLNLERNLGNPPLYLDCLQFMLAPFPQNGDPFKDGDPTRGANVLNNSWGCPPLEGCDADALEPAARALRAAGIFVVASAGNDGPACATVSDPLALYDSVFSVGAIDADGNLADFSSRGPVNVDGSGRVKPDIVAPGVDILSSLPGNAYGAYPGTSMAGPHVVGTVALIWSANPALIGDIDRTEQILIQSAAPYAGARDNTCFGTELPSNAFGYGVLDAYAAVKMALGK